jgi:hypothetical protein
MVRYIDRTDLGLFSLEISFLGTEFNEKEVPPETDIEIRLLKRNHEEQNIPYKEIWLKTINNVVVPKGVWNGMKLGLISDNEIFIAVGNSICKLKKETGEILWKKAFSDNPIKSISLSDSKKDEIYILYAYYKFFSENIKSNFLKIDFHGNLIWSLNIKDEDVAVDFRYRDGSLMVNTWHCFALYVDEQTGEILQSVFTK